MGDDRRSDDRRQTDLGSPPIGERRREDRRSGMDRRSFPRIDVDLWVEQESGEETVFRLAGNLSAGGLYLEHGFTYSVGTRVKLRFVLEEDSPAVEVAAEIVSAVQTEAAPNAASLSFLDLTGEDRARILTFLNAKMSEG